MIILLLLTVGIVGLCFYVQYNRQQVQKNMEALGKRVDNIEKKTDYSLLDNAEV